MFSPYDFEKKNDNIIWSYFKNEWFKLSDQTKLRLNEINKIKEIQERKIMSKKISKYIAAFDYCDKSLIILFATSKRISIISFARIIGAPVGRASANFSLIFSLTAGIIKKLLKITRNKKKKHNKIVMLAKSKLNGIGKLVSQTLIYPEISHEEHKSIISKEENYRRLKENLKWWKVMMEKMN